MTSVQQGVAPAVDVVIAVHSALRPVERAVRSLVAGGLPVGGADGVRVTVVCHNIDVETIRRGMSAESAEHARFLGLDDGIRSPAGPFNHGLDHATGEFVAVMGSDDTVEAGALAQWLDWARRERVAALVVPERHADGRLVRSPIVRVGRSRRLDPVKDRLAYRTAPLGLLRREVVDSLGLRFTAGLATGEDQLFSARLWFSGLRIDYGRGTGCYVVGGDQPDRVTHMQRTVSADLEFATSLVAGDWFTGLPLVHRQALVTKILRIHVFGLMAVREASGGWSEQDRQELATVTRRLLSGAPGADDPLTLADARLLDAILDPTVPTSTCLLLARRRAAYGSPATLVARKLSAQFHPEAPLRIMTAAALL